MQTATVYRSLSYDPPAPEVSCLSQETEREGAYYSFLWIHCFLNAMENIFCFVINLSMKTNYSSVYTVV